MRMYIDIGVQTKLAGALTKIHGFSSNINSVHDWFSVYAVLITDSKCLNPLLTCLPAQITIKYLSMSVRGSFHVL